MSNNIENEMNHKYESVIERIHEAAQRTQRDPEEICLVAVSKTKPVEAIEEAISLGMRHFGENKPQEIRDKVAYFKDSQLIDAKELSWHMIGNIQKNKIKYLIDTCTMIHSIDTLDILSAINEAALKKERVLPILLQVNISMEESKNGFTVEEVYDILPKLKEFTGIRVQGLMTIPPFVKNAEDNRKHFRRLKEIFIDIKSKNIDNVYMQFLSMGMTDDFEVAIEEGATHIRVGTGIFGERNYNLIP